MRLIASMHFLGWVCIALATFWSSAAPAQTGESPDLERYYLTACEYFDEGRLTEAIELFERVEKTEPDYRDTRVKLVSASKFLGIELYGQGQLTEAIKVWNRAAALSPGDQEIIEYITRAEAELRTLSEMSNGVGDGGDLIEDEAVAKDTARSATQSTDESPAEVPSPDLAMLRELSDSVAILNRKLQESDKANESAEVAVPAESDTSEYELSGFIEISAQWDQKLEETSFELDELEAGVLKRIGKLGQVCGEVELVSDGDGHMEAEVEQGYIRYFLAADSTWDFVFGKFNSPVGLNELDAPDRQFFSRSLLFDYGRPANLTGLTVSGMPTNSLRVGALIVNGWDVNRDNNRDKTFGAFLTAQPARCVSTTVSFLSGAEHDDDNSNRRTVVDGVVQARWNAMTLACEANYGTESGSPGSDFEGDWFGLLFQAGVETSSRLMMNARLEYFADMDGIHTGRDNNLKSVTLSPSIILARGLVGLLEFRYDFSNEMVFMNSDGGYDSGRVALALELHYGF